jgi:lysophospholipase L1-like esterase
MFRLFKAVPIGIFFLFISAQCFSQDKPPFWDDIQTIKQYDKIYMPPARPILFIGSSSIRLWVDFTKTFKDYTVLNRGVGGEETNDTDRYLDDIVFPYQPKQLVIYVGENDLLKAPDGEHVFDAFKKLYQHIRNKLPVTPIVYIAIKPSPSRKQHTAKAIKANQLIQQFLKADKQVVFLDVFKPMLDKNGEMRPELFKEDMLHMNANGYATWNKLLLPYLLKD